MYISNYCNYYFISIHAPAKGATRHTHASILLAAFQSTLPRRERHFLSRSRCASSRISIHAPAKGATRLPARMVPFQNISIHAPAKGATLPGCPCRSQLSYFNPRSREGSDFHNRHNLRLSGNFNPRSREGSDKLSRDRRMASVQFQSTLPRRERLYDPIKQKWKFYFNPRSREGSDKRAYVFAGHVPNFNPRSREGSDEKRPHRFDRLRISIHAPAKGATYWPQ